MRFGREGTLWEFDAPVVSAEGSRVRLARAGRLRFVNRRRFPRVATSKPAHVASFPFSQSHMNLGSREFVEGELTEIAGPGLRVEAAVDVEAGERVLVSLQLGEGHVVEALGKVRRTEEGEDGPAVVVELMGLSNDEISQLAHETNVAARQARGEQPSEEEA